MNFNENMTLLQKSAGEGGCETNYMRYNIWMAPLVWCGGPVVRLI